MFGLFSPMWLLGLIPEMLIHTVLGLSIAALIVSMIVPINRFYTVILAIFVGLVMWFEGATWTGREYAEHLNNAREEIAALEQQQEELTKQLEEAYKNEVNTIRSTGEQILSSVEDVVTPDVDAQCAIPNDVRVLHDSAVNNEVPRTSRGVDGQADSDEGTTSGPTLSELTSTVVGNYNSCNEVRAQLAALQKWVLEMQRTHNGGN